MISIIESCQPREGALEGTFNLEAQVMSHYRGRGGRIDNIYTDNDQFFRDGTAPTNGINFVLLEAFSRLSGDNSAPAIYRLETAFGGGKTHTLIALTHLAFLRERNRRRRGTADRRSAAALPRRMQRRRSRRGRAGGASAARAGDLQRADKQSFAQKVAAVLNEASTRYEFDCLVLVAPAHAFGDLRQALDAPTQRKITAQLQKDLTKVPDANLAEHLANLSST